VLLRKISIEIMLNLRPFRKGDEYDIVKNANNRKIFDNVRDRFPHPYTSEHAQQWVEYCLTLPERDICFAVEYKAELVGAVGVVLGEDVFRINAEIGYWLGESFWGRGIATEAVRQMTNYTFDMYPNIHRIWAGVFAHNKASMRVLEKAGYQLECIRHQSVIKNNVIEDDYVYIRHRK
jgi:[ribosomal protein S5]-alanine N-acetyltransferase